MDGGGKRVVRRAMGSGRWYSHSSLELEQDVGKYVENADVPEIRGRIVAAVAPHAGYPYSGKVAGYTFRAIKDNAKGGNAPDTVVVLGFNHRGGLPGVSLMDGDALETPLGEVALDKEAGEILVSSGKRISYDYRPHATGEHSAENEIPFIQVALPGTPVVIGLIGDHDAGTLDDLVTALNELAKKKKVLVVASTDLLHDADYELVTKTDEKTVAMMGAMDHKGLMKEWSPRHQVCCGIGPVLTAIRFGEAQGCREGTVLHCRNSGDDYPESRGSWVVGYGAVVFSSPATE